MSQKLLPQLALLVLVLICSLQSAMPQDTQTDHQNIEANLINLNTVVRSMYGSMIEFRTEVKNDINSLREDLNVLNDSVSNISMCLQEHKKQTVRCSKKIHGPYTCGGTRGWRRVVHLDMTDPCTTCPSGWKQTGYSKRTCGRATVGTNTHDSVTFPVKGGKYSKICGRIRAYQYASPDAFHRLIPNFVPTINNAYVDGVSVTHGTPPARKHIWTFVAGLSENYPTHPEVCQCDANINITIPSFVGNDYFCESALHETWAGQFIFHPNDTLWDGKDCLPSSKCCPQCNLPYFVKQLPTSTTDDIEARICLDQELTDENIAVELVELYVQ